MFEYIGYAFHFINRRNKDGAHRFRQVTAFFIADTVRSARPNRGAVFLEDMSIRRVVAQWVTGAYGPVLRPRQQEQEETIGRRFGIGTLRLRHYGVRYCFNGFLPRHAHGCYLCHEPAFWQPGPARQRDFHVNCCWRMVLPSDWMAASNCFPARNFAVLQFGHSRALGRQRDAPADNVFSTNSAQ